MSSQKVRVWLLLGPRHGDEIEWDMSHGTVIRSPEPVKTVASVDDAPSADTSLTVNFLTYNVVPIQMGDQRQSVHFAVFNGERLVDGLRRMWRDTQQVQMILDRRTEVLDRE